MEGTILFKFVNASITAGYIVLAVIVLRLLLKRAPKKMTVLLWAAVAIRLILPVSLKSVMSLIPSTETFPEDFSYSLHLQSGMTKVNAAVNPIVKDLLGYDYKKMFDPMPVFLTVVFVIWLLGILAMVLYTVISYIRIYKKVREATPLRDNIFLCDHIAAPFLLGVFRPRIYLPSAMSEQDMEYVIAHETAHLKRRDYWWKPLGFLLLTIYWFQPLLWVAYILFCRDIELACDESAIRQLGTESKKPYSDALISCSVPRSAIAAYPLGFGEVGIKNRIKSVLRYKKPAAWAVAASIVVCALVVCCFLTDPYRIFIPKDTPGMTILFEGNEVDYAGGSSSWIYDQGDGTEFGYFMDGIHPLGCLDEMDPVLLPATLPDGTSLTVTFQFSLEPDVVFVRCYDLSIDPADDSWGKLVEDIPVNGNTIELKDGNYLYQVTAAWELPGKYHGGCTCGFRTEKSSE